MHIKSVCNYIKQKNKIVFLIVLICSTILAIVIYSTISNFKNDKIIDTSIIAERLSKISEFSTIKYNYSNIISLKNSKTFKDFSIPFTEKSFLVKYSGYIKAGVDLKDLNVVVNKESVTITLKRSKILDHVINNGDLFVYDEKSSMFNKLSMQDMINEISNEKYKVEADLIKTGFLDMANTNCKLLLQGILLDMGFKNITIIFD